MADATIQKNPVPQPAAAPADRTPAAEALPDPVPYERNEVTWDLARPDHLTKNLQHVGQTYGGMVDQGKAPKGFANAIAVLEDLLARMKREK